MDRGKKRVSNGKEIHKRITSLWEKQGLDRGQFIRHLGEAWCLSEGSTYSYVAALEYAHILLWAQHVELRVLVYEQRLADYFSALDVTSRQTAGIYAAFKPTVHLERVPSEVEPVISYDYTSLVYQVKQVKDLKVLAKIERLLE